MTAPTLSGPPAATAALRRVLAFLLVLGAALTIAACGGGGPQAWLDENLSKVSGSDPDSGISYSADKDVTAAVQQVSGGTAPDDSLVSGGNTFLRYGSDYLVVVAAGAVATAAAVELWTFNAGYAQYGAQVAAWDEFRGGGSGEGK